MWESSTFPSFANSLNRQDGERYGQPNIAQSQVEASVSHSQGTSSASRKSNNQYLGHSNKKNIHHVETAYCGYNKLHPNHKDPPFQKWCDATIWEPMCYENECEKGESHVCDHFTIWSPAHKKQKPAGRLKQNPTLSSTTCFAMRPPPSYWPSFRPGPWRPPTTTNANPLVSVKRNGACCHEFARHIVAWTYPHLSFTNP